MVGDAAMPRVTVLMGGTSGEREVSLVSGRAVASALEQRGYSVERFVVEDDLLHGFSPEGIDAAFIALHGGAGEDGTIQARLQEMGLPYTGSDPRASALAMNKVETKQLLVQQGIPTPEWVELERNVPPERARETASRLGFPVVVKPISQGSTLGVTIVRVEGEMPAAVSEACAFGAGAFVEAYVAGRELTVAILGDRALPVVEVRPAREFYDYRAKYEDDGTSYITEVDVSETVRHEVIAAAEATHRAVGCRDMSRIDMRLSDDGTPYVLEINTIPGLTSRSLLPQAAAAAGMSYGDLVENIVRQALARAEGGSGA